jgi:tetratricopeptide (TPR) repeat protein
MRSRRLGRASAGLCAAFALTLAALWYSGRTDASFGLRGVVSRGAASPQASHDLEPVFIEPPGLGTPPGRAELEEAHALYEQHVRDHPRDAGPHLALARVQVQLGRAERAIATLQSAVDLAPAGWQSRLLLAHAQCAVSRWDECISTLRRARELAPEQAVIWHNLGVALHRRAADVAALEAYERARTLRPTEPRTQLGLAVSQEKAGRRVDAVQSYEEYLRLRPEAPAANEIRARIDALSDGRGGQ